MAHYDSIYHEKHVQEQLVVLEANQKRITDELNELKSVEVKTLALQESIYKRVDQLKDIAKNIAHDKKLISEFANDKRDYVEEWELFNY